MQYPWNQLEPHPEWVEPHWQQKNYMQPYAAGIPGKLRIVFMPPMWNPPKVLMLEPGKPYKAKFFNPSDGSLKPLEVATANSVGEWQVPNPPTFQDWVLVMESS
jgi:hypothetical protein